MGIEHQPGSAETDAMGKKLSLAIGCPVRLDYDKPVFVCHHEIHFMRWIVSEWPASELRKYHEENR